MFRASLRLRLRLVGASGAPVRLGLQLSRWCSSANPFYHNYKSEIEQKLRAEGCSSLEEWKERHRVRAEPNLVSKEPSKHRKSSSNFQALDEMFDVNRARGESKETIQELWSTCHANRERLHGHLSTEIYGRLCERGRTYPWCVLPLPRGEGYEMYFVQFVGDSIYMTTLLDFKVHREHARIHLLVHHYTEFQASHGLVLMQGELVSPNLSLESAGLLMVLLNECYLGDGQCFEQVRLLHQCPDSFHLSSLIKNLEDSVGHQFTSDKNTSS